ncbi:MAG: SRPBCC family protein [Nitriliruptor sp.]|nr:MAG: SRPBCC family protein [Nitriliruptor sp.]
MRLEITRHVAAPRQVLWDVLTDWERQPDWMLDAKAVHVLTPQRTGEGVTLRCPTNLMGVTVQDIMRVTGWEEPSYLEVTHLGKIITGYGAFELAEDGPQATVLTWWEEVDPPLGALGEWGASTLVLPILRRIFGRSLRNLAELAEQDAGAGSTPSGADADA